MIVRRANSTQQPCQCRSLGTTTWLESSLGGSECGIQGPIKEDISELRKGQHTLVLLRVLTSQKSKEAGCLKCHFFICTQVSSRSISCPTCPHKSHKYNTRISIHIKTRQCSGPHQLAHIGTQRCTQPTQKGNSMIVTSFVWSSPAPCCRINAYPGMYDSRQIASVTPENSHMMYQKVVVRHGFRRWEFW